MLDFFESQLIMGSSYLGDIVGNRFRVVQPGMLSGPVRTHVDSLSYSFGLGLRARARANFLILSAQIQGILFNPGGTITDSG